MAKVEITRLPALVRRIEAEVAAIGDAPAVNAHEGYEAFRAHLARYRAVIDGLVQTEGASYRPPVADSARLRIAGLSTSATGGDAALLSNWINATRRYLEPKGNAS